MLDIDRIKVIFSVFVILCTINSTALTAEKDLFQVETKGSYRMTERESPVLAKAVAAFNARRKAVDIAGRYLAGKSLIKNYEMNRDEIYSLAARELQAKIIEERRQAVGEESIFHIRIRASVQASDFIKAEIKDIEAEKKESRASFAEEMEQPVAPEIDPGKDIAKAYRMLREKKWRITLIYLNHLQKKYPNWDRIFMAKALTHYLLHEPAFMEKSLLEACRLENHFACEDLENIRRLGEHDFGLSLPE